MLLCCSVTAVELWSRNRKQATVQRDDSSVQIWQLRSSREPRAANGEACVTATHKRTDALGRRNARFQKAALCDTRRNPKLWKTRSVRHCLLCVDDLTGPRASATDICREWIIQQASQKNATCTIAHSSWGTLAGTKLWREQLCWNISNSSGLAPCNCHSVWGKLKGSSPFQKAVLTDKFYMAIKNKRLFW